jgi:carbonic anhydrase
MEGASDRRGRLAEGNAAFRKATDPALLTSLSKGQHPSMAIISCSDSRVVPEKLFNLSLGDAFVVRVAGNSASDPSILGSLEYAVEHLHVKELLVLGHTGCSAVRLAMDGASPGNLGTVMRDMERAKSKLPVGLETDQDAIAESNVKLQLRLLEDSSYVIRSAADKGQLTVHGAMYDVKTGNVRFL